MRMIGKIISWIAAIFVLLLALLGDTGVLSSILLLATGAFLIPPLRQKLISKLPPNKYKAWVTPLIAIVLFIIAVSVSPSSDVDTSDDTPQNEVNEVADTEEPSDENAPEVEETEPPHVHSWIEVSRTEPTTEEYGVSEQKCEGCDAKTSVQLPKLEKTVTFEEIYETYQENEIRADSLYKNNRYKITAEIVGISNDGLLNLFGGATLTLERRVGNTRAMIIATFDEKDLKPLEAVSVGDTITFEGVCVSWGSWDNCVLVK